LWSSYLENLTATNNEMLSNYQNLMDYTNQSFDILMANLNELDAYTKALNTSYQNNLTLIHAYMAFTNASIQMLNDQLLLVADAEESDIAAVTADLGVLRNYTIRANDLLSGLLNMTDANSTVRDAALSSSIAELRAMTDNLTLRAETIEARAASDNQNQTGALNAQITRLQLLIDELQGQSRTNDTRLQKDISDAKKEGQGNLGLAVLLTFIAGICVTWLAITAHDRSNKEKRHPEEGRPKEEEE